MSDPAQTAMWLGILGAGVVATLVLHRLGLATTYARDLLHVGAGVWVLGWPYWSSPAWPIALATVCLSGTLAIPILARHLRFAAAIQGSVSDGDERWGGLVYYAASFAAFTGLGLGDDPFPAGAALLALSLGDGIGGAIGRRFGAHRFHFPWAKPKSLEGTAAVAVFAALGALLAGSWLTGTVDAVAVLAAGLVAAGVEALSPGGFDNVLVPLAVWLVLQMHSWGT